jgi:type IV pilus assembly protein PilC
MPSFAYTARDSSGAPTSGTLVADSIAEITRLLRADGKYPTSIRPTEDTNAKTSRSIRGVKVSRADVIQLATQLSIMVETGVTLSEGLECISAQAEKPNVKALLADLTQQVQSGGDFSVACAAHPRSFPKVFVALIKASERSGMLGKLMARATSYLRDERETVQRVRGALTYPLIMLGFAISTTVFLLAFVLPKFTAIYAAKGAALPVPTKMLMAVSGFMIDNRILLPLILATVAGLIWAGLRTPRGAKIWHFIQLRLPVMGKLFHTLHLSRSLRTVGTMAGSGVSLLDCVKVAQELSDNSYFRKLWDNVAEEIQAGRQLSEPLFASPLVPRSVAQMIHSAEKGGKLAFVMEQIAGYAEQELKEKIVEMTRYIEPAMIALMGIIIGSVTIALLLPIFTISRVVAK